MNTELSLESVRGKKPVGRLQCRWEDIKKGRRLWAGFSLLRAVTKTEPL
jgi:hypothetical protein